MKKSLAFVLLFILNSELLIGQNNLFPQEKLNQFFIKQGEHIRQKTYKHSPLSMPDPNDLFKKILIKRNKKNKSTFVDSQFKALERSLTIGPNSDTLKIINDTVINQGINIIGNGVLIIEGAKLTVSGSLNISDKGKCFINSQGKLTFDQSFIGELKIMLSDSAYFEAQDAIIDANGSTRSEEFYDHSTYKATRTYYPDWTFRKAYNYSRIYLENINSNFGVDNYAGDLLVYDSCFVYYKKCDVLWPWLQVPSEANIGTASNKFMFPSIQLVNHFEFPGTFTNVSGIGYTMIIDTSTHVWWALDTYPGSNSYIKNCALIGSAQRLYGTDTIDLYGIWDSTYYSGTLPIKDRIQDYQNVFVRWWCWYPKENTVLNIDSCYFGEMVAWDKSIVNITRSAVEGTEQLGTKDSAFASFSDGTIQCFVNAYQNSTLLLNNSYVTPVGGSPISHQKENYSHGFAYLLCTNTKFDSVPKALDASVILFTFIDSLGTINADTIFNIPITGSAWLETGPFNNTAFKQYKLYYQHIDSSSWIFINGSANAVHSNTLGVWNTSGLPDGDYLIMLTIFDSNNDSLSALRKVTLANTTSVNEKNPNHFLFYLYQNYPNPFNPTTKIKYSIPNSDNVLIKVYDELGREVKTLLNEYQNVGQYEIEFDASSLASGVYFYKIVSSSYSETKKMILIR